MSSLSPAYHITCFISLLFYSFNKYFPFLFDSFAGLNPLSILHVYPYYTLSSLPSFFVCLRPFYPFHSFTISFLILFYTFTFFLDYKFYIYNAHAPFRVYQFTLLPQLYFTTSFVHLHINAYSHFTGRGKPGKGNIFMNG